MAVNAEGGYYSSLSGPDKKRYAVKIEDFAKIKYCKSIDPYEIKEWVDDVELWPELEFGDIYTYLIDGKGIYTKETLKSYKSLDAYNYYTRQVIFVMKCIIKDFCFVFQWLGRNCIFTSS